MLHDLDSFFIPCAIRDLQIEGVLCDLGVSMSLMPLSLSLSLCKRLGLLDLTPTTMILRLEDDAIRQPAGILEDVPIQVHKFVIPCNFIIMDMDESFEVPIILGRPFLATAGAVINVQEGTMSFQFCGERVDFCFPLPTPPSVPNTCPVYAVPTLFIPTAVVSGVEISYGGGGPHMRSVVLPVLSPPLLSCFACNTFHP